MVDTPRERPSGRPHGRTSSAERPATATNKRHEMCNSSPTRASCQRRRGGSIAHHMDSFQGKQRRR
eukprot:214296-Alexandrium_andersonii.AAC.1